MTIQMNLGSPLELGPIEVWPVIQKKPSETVSVGRVEQLLVEEIPEPDPGTLYVENEGAEPIFLPVGFLFGGLQQSRMLLEDLYIGAGEALEIPVACVEAGRFSGNQTRRPAGRAPISVVAAGFPGPRNRDRCQQEVWNAVSRQERRSGTRPTHSLEQVMQEDVRTQTTQRQLASEIDVRFAPRDDQVGVVIAISGEPLLIEVFDSPQLARTLLHDLLKGVAFDIDFSFPFPATEDRIKEFLRETSRTPFKAKSSVGASYRLTGSGDQVTMHGTWTSPSECLHLLAINHRHPVLSSVV